ncbi:shikimate dehydrogenase family protein [Pontibacter arcticus]|uniref:Shikimate dehydrogenase n=1 Tax=Pontibacter arcticus TaxID=2080288 RepID=A0A364RI47_9BACT|nr:shikimate dehydrogenase [Pontibacter arcticus]RAU83918.1 shikimate dehydrogenase [Pontibacter arcticus]
MRKYGLIGKKLGHSFSKRYFTEKFKNESIHDAAYDLYELESINELPGLLAKEPELVGLNVTIPYKEAVIPFLDELDEAAARIGAVNTIRISNGKTKGFNTDYIGFSATLSEFYTGAGKALVLGTGGAAKAVCVALQDLGILYTSVSRQGGNNALTYEQIDQGVLQKYDLIINTTPLGMFPDQDTVPLLPFQSITPQHYIYDLVYNPETTLLMQKGLDKGAKVLSGLPMLYRQAKEAWAIWQE